MLGIRPAIVQDENAGVGPSFRGAPTRNKENAGSNSVLGKSALQPLGGSVRKALGNITNTTNRGAENAPIGQQPFKPGASQGKEGRRALGDITNSGPNKLSSRSIEPAKPKPFQQLPSQPASQPLQSASTSMRMPMAPRSKAEIYADDGIERMAGKGWNELEAERKQRENADIENRVRKFTMGLPVWRPTIMSSRNDSDSEDDMDLILSPPAHARKPLACLSSPSRPQEVDDKLLLPSAMDTTAAALPDFGDSECDFDFELL